MLLCVVLLLEVLAGAEVDIFIPSFPELQNLFGVSPMVVELLLSVNFCAYCAGSLITGSLSDRYGRRPVILGGLALFIVGSAFCIVTPSFSFLLVGRFLQGLGIAGPAVLAYVVVADKYSLGEQQRIMGLLNGGITLAMSFAPVIGSYVNLWFNYKGNFVVLLIMGLGCFVLSYFWLPERQPETASALTHPASYKTLLTSKIAWTFIIAVCMLVTPYWVFIGLAPILYMEDLGVPLTHFGYYQGALAATFSVISLSSGYCLKRWGQLPCFFFGLSLCVVSGVLMILGGVWGVQNPLLITGIMLILSSGQIFPVNVIYPASLEVAENAKGRMAALVGASRLLVTAFALELVSYFYNGTFLPLALAIVLCLGVAFCAVFALFRQQVAIFPPSVEIEAD